jgi:hypothetical protein
MNRREFLVSVPVAVAAAKLAVTQEHRAETAWVIAAPKTGTIKDVKRLFKPANVRLEYVNVVTGKPTGEVLLPNTKVWRGDFLAVVCDSNAPVNVDHRSAGLIYSIEAQ